MKDTIITAAVKRRELWILLVCFIVANVVNWCAILKFERPWWEIFSQIGYVVVTTLVIYDLLLALRAAWWIIQYLLGKR